MGRRSLGDHLSDDAVPLLPDGYWRHRPPSERLALFRSLRGRLPGSLRLAPGRGLAAGETLKAQLHSVFTDSPDPYCVFIENRSGIQYYFRVPLRDLAEKTVWVER